MNRLDEPTVGTVRLNGQDYRELPAQDLRRRIGMVMQRAYLFPGTVAANVGPDRNSKVNGYPRADCRAARARRPARIPARDVSNLSGGEAQRVSLARTLANAPVALLLDEPTSALDEASSRAIEELLLDVVRERQMVCAIVTHNTEQARRIADRTMIIEKGKLVAIGPTEQVLDAH